MDTPTESTSPQDTHGAFDLLAQGLQRQLYAMKWPSLRPIQVAAIRTYLQTDRHLLIMAETAGGKTEAAFLPVLSSIVDYVRGSVRALYVGPLKALINDQFARLEMLCTHLEMPVHRWHGDVAANRKDALIRDPGGVLLITPESLESLLVNRTAHLHDVFGGLRAIVIDEVHAFLDGERGLHLASLLLRLQRYRAQAESPLRLIGLSATVGEPRAACRYLRPDGPDQVEIIRDSSAGTELQFRVHGYDTALIVPDASADTGTRDEDQAATADDDDLRLMAAIGEDLVEHCRTHSNLVFANAKGDIELYVDLANESCRTAGLPETFLVHHGSLSKEVREDTEDSMKSSRAMTTICSSTLEMGIDIGAVRMVGQIGAPWSVVSLKQRMGRSGRKPGEPRRLRCYVDCTARGDRKEPLAQLPLELLQTAAICELMLERWVEPPRPARLDSSTLTHQIISTIAEIGALDAALLHHRLCSEGPFRGFSSSLFARVLRALGAADVVEQGPDGKLILGLEGERLRSRRDFYAAFASRVEFDVVAGDRVLGTLPIDTLPKPGDHIVFAGRRWQVLDIDMSKQALRVTPARRRQRPRFTGAPGDIHRRVREKMLSLLHENRELVYLDSTAAAALERARRIAKDHHLAHRGLIPLSDNRVLWLTWVGTADTRTLMALLASAGIDARDEQIAIECRVAESDLTSLISTWRQSMPDRLVLAEHVQPKQHRKYDYLMPSDLLDEGLATDLALDAVRSCAGVP